MRLFAYQFFVRRQWGGAFQSKIKDQQYFEPDMSRLATNG
jgi:hypothetical protein